MPSPPSSCSSYIYDMVIYHHVYDDHHPDDDQPNRGVA